MSLRFDTSASTGAVPVRYRSSQYGIITAEVFYERIMESTDT